MNELGIADKMHTLHESLRAGGVPHAFGGALALAWCVQEVRATVDIDVNLFLPVDDLDRVLAALPDDVTWAEREVALLQRDGQARLRWGRHPIDMFLNTTPFHTDVAGRVRWESLAGRDLPFLACADLAVFKAFFDRAKDWVDLSTMAARDTGPLERAIPVLAAHLGRDDPRVARLTAIVADPSASPFAHR